MDGRSEHWLSRFLRWLLPGLAALDPTVAAYSAAYVDRGPFSKSARPDEDKDAVQVIRGPFQAAEARR